MAGKFSFYGKVDRDKISNKVNSEYPAWMLVIHRDKLADEIDSMKRRLRSGGVELAAKESLKDEILKSETRLKEIDRSRPNITAPMKDKIANHYNELSKLIQASMYTRADEKNGFADAHDELKRMHSPCIEVNPELAAAANIELTEEFLASRNDATKLWKIMGHILGKATNVERLRK